jgi:hypothetical protein
MIEKDKEWTISDEVWTMIFDILMTKDRIRQTFHDGCIRTLDDWLAYWKNPNIYAVLVIDNKRVVGIAWLNNLAHGTAEANFCALNHYIPGGGALVIDYWNKTFYPYLKILLVYTPESYDMVLRLCDKWGFKFVGPIPNYFDMFFKGIREGAMIFCYQLGEKNGQIYR